MTNDDLILSIDVCATSDGVRRACDVLLCLIKSQVLKGTAPSQ